jgi:hypothetical protein
LPHSPGITAPLANPRRVIDPSTNSTNIISPQKFGSQPREPVAKAAFRPKDALERIASASFKETAMRKSILLPAKAAVALMASGVSGMVRYSGVVVGFAVLGAILFARISSSVLVALPNISASDGIGLIRHIAAGDLSGTLAGAVPQATLQALAMRNFGDGYRASLIAASTLLRTWTRCWPPNIFGAELRQPEGQGQQEDLQSTLAN